MSTDKVVQQETYTIPAGRKMTSYDTRTIDSLTLILNRFGKKILFETGSHIIKPASFSSLDDVSSFLLSHGRINVFIEGHTDNVGSEAHNLVLSHKRAESVRAYLTNKGVSSQRLFTMGYGESKPITADKGEKSIGQNRRVEFKIVVPGS